jgi:hypothetical protein
MATKDVKPWIITGYVFTAVYVLLGLAFFSAQEWIVGPLVLIAGVLFGAGSLLASKGNFSAARVLMMIGGVLALPLGLVMIMAGSRFGAAAPSQHPPSILS